MAAPDARFYERKPPSPPIVELNGETVAHLLCWEWHERDGSWHAWVSWVQSAGNPNPIRHKHYVVAVHAGAVTPLEPPEAYKDVPRRVFGNDGKIRPWTRAGEA